MDVALLCPLQVGVVAWANPRPFFTAVVKATFSIARDGEAVLAREQRPLVAEPTRLPELDELSEASDFAPQKERVDVLLLGHAHAAAPSRIMAVSLSVGELHKSFVAVAAVPSNKIPLTGAHLRTDASASAQPVRVGALSPRSPARRALAGDQRLDPRGVPVGALDESFDFAFFNAAPYEQQLDVLPNGATLTLTGLLDGAPRRDVQMPHQRPLVYLMDAAAERCITKVGMRCDTLVIDSDRAELAVVWRGAFDAAAGVVHPALLVAYEPPGTRWSNPEARDRFRHAPRSRAAEPGGRHAPESAPRAYVPTELPRARVPARVPTDDEMATLELVRAPLQPRAATEITHVTRTLTAVAIVGAPALPFRAADEATPLSFEPATFRPAPDQERTDVIVGGPARAPLPFRAPASTNEAPGDQWRPPDVPRAPLPPPEPLRPAASPPAPVVVAPRAAPEPVADELLPVAAYAAIKRAIMNHPRSGMATLQRKGFDRASWKRQEQMQSAAIESEALGGQRERAAGLLAALGPGAAEPEDL